MVPQKQFTVQTAVSHEVMEVPFRVMHRRDRNTLLTYVLSYANIFQDSV